MTGRGFIKPSKPEPKDLCETCKQDEDHPSHDPEAHGCDVIVAGDRQRYIGHEFKGQKP